MKKLTGWHIIVVESGFVFAGDVADGDKDTILVQRVNQLRRWGTTKGLGELVNGPTSATQMDSIPVILIPRSRIIFTIPVNAEKWIAVS